MRNAGISYGLGNLVENALRMLVEGTAQVPATPEIAPRVGSFAHAMPAYLREGDITAMKWILAHGFFSSVLEIGCGNGELLTLLRKELGCEVQGVDPSVVRQAKATTSGVPIAASLDELEPSKRFELVISSHALEHVVDPGAMLRVLADRATDDGLVYVEVPALELSGIALPPGIQPERGR